jgi:hypothetical protein
MPAWRSAQQGGLSRGIASRLRAESTRALLTKPAGGSQIWRGRRARVARRARQDRLAPTERWVPVGRRGRKRGRRRRSLSSTRPWRKARWRAQQASRQVAELRRPARRAPAPRPSPTSLQPCPQSATRKKSTRRRERALAARGARTTSTWARGARGATPSACAAQLTSPSAPVS